MNRDKIKEKLISMMDQYWFNKSEGRVYKFMSFKEDGDNYIIVTDRAWITKHQTEMSLFFDNHQRAEQPASEMAIISNDQKKEISSGLQSLTATLMESIEKIKTDPSYIPQAKAINNNVNSIVNTMRLQLDILKETKKAR